MNIKNIVFSLLRNKNDILPNLSMIGHTARSVSVVQSINETQAFTSSLREETLSSENIIHPFFCAKLFYPLMYNILVHPDLNINLLRLVHAGQHMSWIRQARIGEKLLLASTIHDISDTPAGANIIIRSQLAASGETIITADSSFIIRKRVKSDTLAAKENISFTAQNSFSLITDLLQPRDYARASGDRNPIHTNRFIARAAGFSGRIMHGMCILAITAGRLNHEFSKKPKEGLAEISCRFSKPVTPGDHLLLSVNEMRDNIVNFELTNSSSKTVLKNGLCKFHI